MESSAELEASQASSSGPPSNGQPALKARSRTTSTALNSSTNSIASSENLHDGSSGMRSSGDGTLSKFVSRTSEDGQNGEGTRRRMSRLFKGRRRRRKSVAPDEGSQVDITEDVPPMLDSTKSLATFQSEESLGLHKSAASSMITEDSDTEASPAPIRPSISPHQSHAGYLTLSSPLINSETVESIPTSSLVPADSAASEPEATTGLKTEALTIGSTDKRAPSPIGKLKEAFTPTRRATSPKPPTEPETSRPSTSGSGLGSLFGGAGKSSGSKKGSKVLEDSQPTFASPESIRNSAAIQSTPSLPHSAPKRIITTSPATPPNLVEAPTTLVTPPTPTDVKPSSPADSISSAKGSAKHIPSQSNPNIVVSPSGNMITHRRVRSATNPPSKLSNSILAPLSPTVEEAKTPGGTIVAQSPSGFFSSVFSAAQNAANTISSTVANTASGLKPKTNNHQSIAEEPETGDVGGEEVIGPENADIPPEAVGTVKRRLAVETLGSGDLSLAQLGISDSSDLSPMSSNANLSTAMDQNSANAEDVAVAQAVSDAYGTGKIAVPESGPRPRSETNPSDKAVSPSRRAGEMDSPSTSVQRTGSIRSRISGGRRRRHRGSSATTSNTIAAAIGASTTTLAPQIASQINGQRLNGTGFAVASPKRNRDFHNLFKSVPEDDYLIEDYSAALQKEILLQGRLYISEGHLCFSSNILGWVTNLVISFDEVVSVEKKSTAVVFPNAIVIQTLHARNVFASFLSRDSTYDLIIGIWKISHPNLKSSLNGVMLDGSGTGDKTEKAESVASDEGSDEDSDEEVYDEDAEEDGIGSFTDAGEGSIAGSEQGSIPAESRKVSATIAAAQGASSARMADVVAATVNNTAQAQDFPGPATHAPTDCGDADAHYDKLLIDTQVPAPLGKIYSLMFGPASGGFMRRFLLDDIKQTDLQLEDDKKGLGDDRKSLSYSYIKPLGGGIGPKQTKCQISMTLEQFDLEKAVSVLCSTVTPDVPSGNIFVTKTRYCLMWASNNTTRLVMTYTVEWSGKSWLKGPIEKGAGDGQLTYATSIASALRAAVKAPSRPVKGAKAKKRSKQSTEDSTPTVTGPGESTETAAKAKTKSWGPLEPVRGLLGPVADVLESLFSTHVLIAFLLAMVMWLYFTRSPSTAGLSAGQLSLSTPQRLAAYEEIWRAEENELWKWLDERVAMDQAVNFGKGDGLFRKQRRNREMEDRLMENPPKSMNDREIDEAIRVTEERLEAMKEAVLRRRGSTS